PPIPPDQIGSGCFTRPARAVYDFLASAPPARRSFSATVPAPTARDGASRPSAPSPARANPLSRGDLLDTAAGGPQHCGPLPHPRVTPLPPRPLNETTDFNALFARERWLVMRERHRQAITMRWYLVVLAVVLGLAGRWTGALDITVAASAALALTTFLGNLAAALLIRAGKFAPWQFWLISTLDAVVIAGFAWGLGPRGYLVLPYLIFAVGGYALGMPRVARVQLALAAVLYPAGRWLGLRGAPGAAPVIAIETVFLVSTAWL